MKLTTREIQIYESLKSGKTSIYALAEALGMSKQNIIIYCSRLTKKGYLRRVDRGVYERIEKKYLKSGDPLLVQAREEPDMLLGELEKEVDPEIREFILNQYKAKVKRSEIARRAGIPKLIVNHVLCKAVGQ